MSHRVYRNSPPAPRPAPAIIECYGCDRPVKHHGDVCPACRWELGVSHVNVK